MRSRNVFVMPKVGEERDGLQRFTQALKVLSR